MNIDEMTIDEVKKILALFGKSNMCQIKQRNYPVEVGKSYLFRGMTYFWTGRVKEIIGTYAVLEDAAWIPSTGRFSECMKDGGMPEEVEPAEGVMVNMDACNDIVMWQGRLPTGVI